MLAARLKKDITAAIKAHHVRDGDALCDDIMKRLQFTIVDYTVDEAADMCVCARWLTFSGLVKEARGTSASSDLRCSGGASHSLSCP